MPPLPIPELATALANVDAATSIQGRGRAFEDYFCLLLGAIPGISVVQRNALNAFQTEEVDIAFWNEQASDGLAFFPSIMLVECKNWSTPVGSTEVSYFASRLQHRSCTHGVLFAANGITGDPASLTAAQFELAAALTSGTRVIVVTRSEAELLTTSEEFVRLMKVKLCQLTVRGTL